MKLGVFALSLFFALSAHAQDSVEPIEGLPTTRLELIERAIAAIQAQDVDAYLALFLDFESLHQHCPGAYIFDGETDVEKMRTLYDEEVPRRRERIEAQMKACHELIDFSSAELLWREGGGWDDPIDTCPLTLAQLDDLELYYRIGDTLYEVEIDDPVSLGDDLSFFVTDDPRCRVSGRAMRRFLREGDATSSE